MALSYSQITFAQARTELAARLGDVNKVFWVDAELKLYVIEALQTWNSLAAFYKDRDSLTTSPNQPYYDLPSSLSAGLRAYNVTDLQLLTEIEYHLMEPPTGATWTGSEMFTVQDILTALQRRRDQFLNETGTVLTRQTFAVSAPTEGRVLLTLSSPFNIIDIRRVAWKDTPSGQYSTLWRESRDALDFFFASWKTSTKPLPKVYSVSDTQPLQIQLAPIPSDAGTLEVLTVNTGNTLTGTGTLMGVPDDLVWIIKFGALADLLQKDGPARDPGRAEYCNKRWEQGVAAAKMPLSTISCLVQDQPVNTESVFDLDVYRANWQNAGTGLPTIAGLAGLNLMALSPTPNSFYTVQVDLLRNMPIPVGDGDFIQVGSEMVDAVLRYALHLAMFKSGGAEFSTTMPDLKQFIDLAIEQNSRLRANDAFITMTMDRSELEEKQRARLSS
jgi:hypothetical protein